MEKKRLTYDCKGRHFCDYSTREIINRLAECEIMLDKIEKIMAKRPKDMISSNPTLRAISEVVEDGKRG